MKVQFITMSCPWLCYILKSTHSKHKRTTYNGATVDFSRRLRQHNGEIVGGAKFTRGKGPWEPLCLITGFIDKKEALQAEWRIKKVLNGKRRPAQFCSPLGRLRSLPLIFSQKQFTSNSQRTIDEGSFRLFIHDDFYDAFCEEYSFPKNVRISPLSSHVDSHTDEAILQEPNDS